MTKIQNGPGDKLVKPRYLAGKWLLHLFKSSKFAIILILVLCFIGLLGVFLPQVPSEFAFEHSSYTWWLENIAYGKFGQWTDALSLLGLFNVFHSFWFLFTGTLLVLNIIICTVSRFKNLKTGLAGTKTILDKDFYFQGNHHSAFEKAVVPDRDDVDSLITQISHNLQHHGYRINKNESKNEVYIRGDKNRFSLLGTYLVHLSLLIFVLGFLMGSYMGFRNTSFIIAENEVRDIDYNTGISVGLESFTDEYWPDGTPKNYQSHIVLFEKGKEVKSGIIKVNHPLSYKGIRFYQLFFGPAVKMRINDVDNTILFEGNIALPGIRISQPLQRPEGGLKLNKTDYSAVIIGSAINGEDTSISKNEVGVELYGNNSVPIGWAKLEKEIPQKIEGISFTFLGVAQYSGLQVSRDPGNIFIWIASFLFLVGLVMIFYFPRRQVWIMFYPDSSDMHLLLRVKSDKGFSADNEFKKITNELKTELNFTERIKI